MGLAMPRQLRIEYAGAGYQVKPSDADKSDNGNGCPSGYPENPGWVQFLRVGVESVCHQRL